MDFRHFWAENLAHAWHLGHGLFWEIESLVNIVTLIIGFTWKRVRKWKAMKAGQAAHDGHELPQEHWWHYWENNLMLGALLLSMLVFLFTVVFVAPFQRYEEEKERADNSAAALT